jgi:phosphohistidine phosphatase SixA
MNDGVIRLRQSMSGTEDPVAARESDLNEPAPLHVSAKRAIKQLFVRSSGPPSHSRSDESGRMIHRAHSQPNRLLPAWSRPGRRSYSALLCMLLLAGRAGSADTLSADHEAALWAALRAGEAAALMRHALAPGTGDPANFDIDDCRTQRNLSDAGRAQAETLGDRWRTNGIDSARVYSSRWCRCLDTARLLELGPVQPFDGLNSFFRDRAAEPERSAAVLALIREQTHPGAPPLLLVTHQVNITALSDVFPDSGEIIVVRPNGARLELMGRIPSR